MNAADVIAYVCDGELYCAECVQENTPARYSGCGQFARLSDPGWHRGCYLRGDDGSPCHAVAREGEDPYPVFGDSETDSPRHCPTCESLIPESLTSEGVAYVLDALDEHRNGGDCVAPEYRPEKRSLMLEWAEMLEYHNLDTREQCRLDRWERWTERPCNAVAPIGGAA